MPCVPDVKADLDALGDKLALAGVARDAGVAYPETLVIEGSTGPDDVVHALGLPVVVKAATSALLVDGSVHAHAGAVLVTTAESLSDAAGAIRDAGTDADRAATRRARREDRRRDRPARRTERGAARVSRRARRPAHGRPRGHARDRPVGEGSGRDAIEALERVCAAAGYDGIANGEFCVGADGTTMLIEVNARPWASMWFAERLGQRVAERCVRLAAGIEPLPPAPPPRRRRYHHVVGELQWASLHDRVAPRIAELVARTRPWDVFEYDDLGDPWPLLRHAARRATGRG